MICVIGLGKLGIPLLSVLSKHFHVIGVDINEKVVNSLKKKICPINEPNIVLSNDYEVTTDIKYAVKKSEIIFIIVPTPSLPDGRFSNDYIESVCDEVDFSGKTIVITSTVMPGTLDLLYSKYVYDCKLIYNPSFIALGSVVHDLEYPNFILIGEKENETNEVVEIHRMICKQSTPIYRMSYKEAEIAKITLNAFCTMKITFANQVARICRENYCDSHKVLDAIGSDPRISVKAFKPGLAVGGPCFPRDSRAFSKISGIETYANHTDKFREEDTDYWVKQILQWSGKILVLGTAYKSGTDIVEESAGLKIYHRLIEAGREVTLDPDDDFDIVFYGLPSNKNFPKDKITIDPW